MNDNPQDDDGYSESHEYVGHDNNVYDKCDKCKAPLIYHPGERAQIMRDSIKARPS